VGHFSEQPDCRGGSSGVILQIAESSRIAGAAADQSAVGSRQSAVGSRQSAVSSQQSAVFSRQSAVSSRQ